MGSYLPDYLFGFKHKWYQGVHKILGVLSLADGTIRGNETRSPKCICNEVVSMEQAQRRVPANSGALATQASLDVPKPLIKISFLGLFGWATKQKFFFSVLGLNHPEAMVVF